MASLNIDLDFLAHPKTRRLVGLLGKNSESLLIRLWTHCGKFHPNGELKGYSPAEVESACDWDGQSGAMLEAMLKVGFIEQAGDGFKVHDWRDHQGHLDAYKTRAKAGAKARWDKVRALSVASDSPSNASSDAASNALTLPNVTSLSHAKHVARPVREKSLREKLREAKR